MRRALAGGASVGLSLLLAGLLLAAAERGQDKPAPPETTAAPTVPVPPADDPAGSPPPRQLRLPPPPRPATVPPPVRTVAAPPQRDAAARQLTPLKPRGPAPARRALPAGRSPLRATPRRADAGTGTARVPAPSAAPSSPPPPAPATTTPSPSPSQSGGIEGAVLLRLLEHGRGPSIEFAWPQNAAERERLYRTFRRCFGMVVALADGGGRLYVADRAGAWQPDGDRYSGFARSPRGRPTRAERRDVAAIAQRHVRGRAGTAIRVFPRRIDAYLLGALHGLLGQGYGGARRIAARYRLIGGRVVVGEIRVDGASRAGQIDLSAAARRSCA